MQGMLADADLVVVVMLNGEHDGPGRSFNGGFMWWRLFLVGVDAGMNLVAVVMLMKMVVMHLFWFVLNARGGDEVADPMAMVVRWRG